MKVGSVSPELIITHLGLERDADGDVAVGAVDRAEDGPDLVLVGLLDDLVARGAPEAVVVADHELEGDLALQVAAAGVPLLDGEPEPWSIGMPSASSWLLPPVATETVGMIGPMKPTFTVSRCSGLGLVAAGARCTPSAAGSSP